MRSDVNHVCLLRLTATLELLTKHQLYADSLGLDDEEHGNLSVIDELTILQSQLRENAVVPLAAVVRPFARLLKDPSLSAPFKLSALEALNGIAALQQDESSAEAVLGEVVDAVIECRFVQADAHLDEIVALSIFETLSRLLSGSLRRLVNDETFWRIVLMCHSTVVSQADNSPSTAAQSAQRLLFFALNALLEYSAAYGKVGLPCIAKCLSHFVTILEDFLLKSSSQSMRLSLSNSSLSLLVGNLDVGKSEDADFTGLLAVNCLHSILLGNGDLSTGRRVIASCSPLLRICVDDLPKLCILYCTKRPTPTVLLTVLPLVQTLLQLFMPLQKVLLECAMVHIYLKALYQLKLLLGDLSADRDEVERPKHSPSSFDTECIGVILSSLSDLLSEQSSLSLLFISFDCDPSRPDIALPLLDMLCHCAYFALTDVVKDAVTNSLIDNSLQCLVRIVKFMNQRLDSQLPDKAEETRSFPSVLSHHFSMSLRAKGLLNEACRLFTEKPSRGISFMLDKGILASPLSSSNVSRFLRMCPSLPKDIVGSFLGELGKDDPKEAVDGKVFHAEVLASYVRSFKFNGQSLLSCIRIFLSAFRLPGEAQQIDRIIGAFSEHCHTCCIEGTSGVLQNSMVTYLLTFSIIMLQTDRHNPNIREDRKMTLEQFIRNNLNYGIDINQTQPLPQEFLEEIFHDICKHPIRTEKNDFESVFRKESWEEMQLSVSSNPTLAVVISSGFSKDLLDILLSQQQRVAVEEVNRLGVGIPNEINDNEMGFSIAETAEEAAAEFLHESHGLKTLLISRRISDCHGVVDQEIFRLLWKKLIRIAFVPFLTRQDRPSRLTHETQDVGLALLGVGIEILLYCLRAASESDMAEELDVIVAMLAGRCGLIAEHEILSLVGDFDSSPALISSHEQFSGADTLKFTTTFLERLLSSVKARTALSTLLQLSLNSPKYFTSNGWRIFFRILGLLRDCSLLPKNFVLSTDSDDLPAAERAEFEEKLVHDRKANIALMKSLNITPEFDGSKISDCPSRWDDGYNGHGSNVGINWMVHRLCSEDFESKASFETAFGALSEVVLSSNLEDLIPSTRFIDEGNLKNLTTAIFYEAEAEDAQEGSFPIDGSHILPSFLRNCPPPSRNSCCWFEILAIELCQRNRDRFSSVWPLLDSHYSLLKKAELPSYVHERRLVGLLRLSARSLARRNLSSQIIGMLQSVFLSDETSSLRLSTTYAGQIALGMFTLFTHNVSFLPQLRLNQWQVLFDIVALISRQGGFPSVKAFETMAWLLHEPRLVR